MFSLQAKVAVVTGGRSGIGAAVTARFRESGACVVVLDIADGADARVNVADESELAEAFDAVVAEHGRIDVLVNNAGTALDPRSVGEETTARMLRLFRVNTLGVLYGTKHAARVMGGGGSIVNIGSLAGGLAWADNAAYAVSKSGVDALTRSAAVELAPLGIRVNGVNPSMIETPMVAHDIPALHAERAFVTSTSPLGRTGTVDEVAAVVHFLASDDCGYLTGQIITVDGGLSAGPSAALLRPPAPTVQYASKMMRTEP